MFISLRRIKNVCEEDSVKVTAMLHSLGLLAWGLRSSSSFVPLIGFTMEHMHGKHPTVYHNVWYKVASHCHYRKGFRLHLPPLNRRVMFQPSSSRHLSVEGSFGFLTHLAELVMLNSMSRILYDLNIFCLKFNPNGKKLTYRFFTP